MSDASLSAWVRALGVHRGELLVGGDFIHVDGQPSPYFARWTDTGVPWVARQPESAQVEAGQSAAFTALPATGYDFDGPLTYRWTRNGQPVVDGPGGASNGGGTVSGSATAQLIIDGVARADAGDFECEISNGCGGIVSDPATLAVGCYADCDLSTGAGVLDFFDFICFQDSFGTGGPYACDCDTSTGAGVCDFFDFICFQDAFATGC